MDIHIKQDIRFYHYRIQIDEHHEEKTFMTVGKPPRTMKEIQKEAEDEFYRAVYQGFKSDLNQLILQKLAENGYQEIEYENSISYDAYEMHEEYVKDLIQAKKGDWKYNEAFKERLKRITKESEEKQEPVIKVKPSTKHWNSPILENTKNPFDALQTFNDAF